MKGCMNFEEEGTEVVGGREREEERGREGEGAWTKGGGRSGGDREGARNIHIRELIQLWECGREFN